MLRRTASSGTHNVIHDNNTKNDGELFKDKERTTNVGGSDLANIGGGS